MIRYARPSSPRYTTPHAAHHAPHHTAHAASPHTKVTFCVIKTSANPTAKSSFDRKGVCFVVYKGTNISVVKSAKFMARKLQVEVFVGKCTKTVASAVCDDKETAADEILAELRKCLVDDSHDIGDSSFKVSYSTVQWMFVECYRAPAHTRMAHMARMAWRAQRTTHNAQVYTCTATSSPRTEPTYQVGKNAHIVAAKEAPKVEEVVGTGKVWEGAAAEEDEKEAEEEPAEEEENGAADEVRASVRPSSRLSVRPPPCVLISFLYARPSNINDNNDAMPLPRPSTTHHRHHQPPSPLPPCRRTRLHSRGSSRSRRWGTRRPRTTRRSSTRRAHLLRLISWRWCGMRRARLSTGCSSPLPRTLSRCGTLAAGV